MSPEQDKKNAAYIYSINLLWMLVKMQLITEVEYECIKAISERYYLFK